MSSSLINREPKLQLLQTLLQLFQRLVRDAFSEASARCRASQEAKLQLVQRLLQLLQRLVRGAFRASPERHVHEALSY